MKKLFNYKMIIDIIFIVERKINMQVSYNNLFKKLIDKGLKKTEFAKEAGISPGTLAKLSKNETILMENLLKIYKFLGCNSLDEIIEVID